MSKEKYIDTILKYLADKEGQSIRPRKLARRMGVSDEDYGDFRVAFKKLRDQGRIVLGAKNTLTLPVGRSTVVGRFHANPKGFGFISPDDPETKADIFVPNDKTMGAMTGDLVQARLIRRGNRGGEMRYVGEVVEIRERGLTRCVGTLEETDGTWFVLPDGTATEVPVVIRDVPVEHRRAGTKVLAEIIWYPTGKGFPEGIISRTLGPSGEPRVELLGIMLSKGLAQEFSGAALAQAKQVAASFDPESAPYREDVTDKIVVTIDPETARDYDDAISLESLTNGDMRLGVHIADVSHFVAEGSLLDEEAYARGTSVYFPRHVVPMLPSVLSNGVCSLQEGVPRFTKSVYIDYDASGAVRSVRLAESIIRSSKRLTYEEAQAVIDGADIDLPAPVVDLVRQMATLARRIEGRRRSEGMLHLNLPEVALTLDDDGAVIDAEPADDAYTHTIIEMFMVEANDQVAAFFAEKGIPIMRRIHPPPEPSAFEDLATFVNACGFPLSDHPAPTELQALIASVADKPESYAVNLALLKSFQRATYSVEREPHFALASPHYCHFTSPIRRYPDLMVHRTLARVLRSGQKKGDGIDAGELAGKAAFLSARERLAQAAEQEARMVLVLGHLESKIGEVFNGVITGVTDFGMFVQSPKFLVEGLIRLQALGDDWWNVSGSEGKIRGEISGKVYKVGDVLPVRIARVDIPRRFLDLSLRDAPKPVRAQQPETGTPNGGEGKRPHKGLKKFRNYRRS